MRTPGGTVALSVSLVALLAASCTILSPYDPTSYKLATELKAESLLLLDKAKDAPDAHAQAIADLRLKLNQAYEYEKGKGKPNALTVKQWSILVDEDRKLLGGFLKKWESEGTGQSPAFIQGMKKNVGDAFDQIIELERHKVRD